MTLLIKNWSDLIQQVESVVTGDSTKSSVMKVLQDKLKQLMSKYAKNKSFDRSIIIDNHLDTFQMYVLLFEQLLIENDPTDIFIDINGLESEEKIMFHIVGTNKWIKLHNGNPDRVFFYDDEKTILSDKIISDFVNKLAKIRSKYKYFGSEPKVYYKFKSMPNEDIVKYLQDNSVEVVLHENPTPKTTISIHQDKIILDQSVVLTLCSNLSHGLSTKYFLTENSTTSEKMVQNRIDLEAYIADKELYIAESMYAECKFKIDKMSGPSERERFHKINDRLKVIPDCINKRFYYLKDNEAIITSTAEKYLLTIVTGNLRLCNKLAIYYREMSYKHFYPAQLSENKFD